MNLDNYALPVEYRTNLIPASYAADGSELRNQFAVYSHAKELFNIGDFSRVVDIGCSTGAKLIHFWPNDETIGIDWGSNLDQARRTAPKRTWLPYDLEQPGLAQAISDWNQSLVICADVIEHLQHPEHLLESLQQAVAQGAVCVLSTPDRDLCRGLEDRGPPANPCHVREWRLGELFTLVSAYCPIRHVQLVPWRPEAEFPGTIVFELGRANLN